MLTHLEQCTVFAGCFDAKGRAKRQRILPGSSGQTIRVRLREMKMPAQPPHLECTSSSELKSIEGEPNLLFFFFRRTLAPSVQYHRQFYFSHAVYAQFWRMLPTNLMSETSLSPSPRVSTPFFRPFQSGGEWIPLFHSVCFLFHRK